MTERIDHAADAVKTMDETLSYGGYGEDAGAIASMLAAQVRATLALVEQQRIANLIALARPHKLPSGAEVRHMLHDHVTGELRADVAEAVGL